MDTSTLLIFGIVGTALFVAIFVIISRMEAQERSSALQTVAQQMGFTFVGKQWDHKEKAQQLGTALFKRGSRSRFRNIMTGSVDGHEANLFDFCYTISAGEESSTYTQTVATFSQKLWLPDFELRPQGILDRVAEAFVVRDISFDSHPDFSRRYFLRGSNEVRIRSLFAAPLLTFFQELPANEKWHVEANLTTLIIYQSKVEIPPEEFRGFLDKTSAIATAVFSSPAGVDTPVR
jgi:hypothetical protein